MRTHCIKMANGRYFIVDESDNVVDDAQGYGFRSPEAAWNYAYEQAWHHNPNFAHLLFPGGREEFMPQKSAPKSIGLF